MWDHLSFNPTLRKLILGLVIFSVISLFLVSLAVSYYIQKQQLIDNSLSVNFEYATKIATGVDHHFQTITKELGYSAHILGKNFDQPEVIEAEVKSMQLQSDYFDRVLIFDHQGRIKDFSPETLKLKKNQLVTTLGVRESLQLKKPYISPPFYSAINNLVVIVTHPIFDKNNKYLGFISGNIFLKEENIISKLLTIKYGYKDSYMYVIDNTNRIIFHPDPARIGEVIQHNTGLAFMHQTPMGKIHLVNSRGIDNLAGFAHIPTTNWVVVSQQPTKSLLRQADLIIYKTSIGIGIFYLLVFFMVWKVSHSISSPMNRLANIASHLNDPEAVSQINSVKPWYFELYHFKFSLLLSANHFNKKINELNMRVNTDPLTGLYNRRGMDTYINELIKNQTPFSVITLDIDYFKNINDTYGHGIGDVVLQRIAQYMQQNFRENDVCCRVGGEEFIVLTPMTEREQAYVIAERLRSKLEITRIDDIGSVTLSIGIAHWPHTSKDIKEVLKAADNYLYQAKTEGRNCIRY